jgi:hypothetical protein
MHINATDVTRLRHGEHIADTGVERKKFLKNIFCEAAAASRFPRTRKVGLSCPVFAGEDG